MILVGLQSRSRHVLAIDMKEIPVEQGSRTSLYHFSRRSKPERYGIIVVEQRGLQGTYLDLSCVSLALLLVSLAVSSFIKKFE